jgi:drug/metabolite transporter (DMT)-like permease
MNFFWAALYSSYKVIGPELAPGGIVTLRFGLAALSMLVFWPWLPGACPKGRDLAVSALMGLVLFVLGQRLQVLGNQLGTAGNSAVLMALEPLVTSVAAAVFLRERIGPRRLAGFGLGLAGVGMLHGIWRPEFHWAGLSASLIFVSSFVCEAAYSVLGKPMISRVGVMKMLTVSLLAGTVGNLALDGGSTMAAARLLPVSTWGLLLTQALICTTLGYTIWFVIIRECPISVAALTVFAQSVFGVAIAAVWVGEKLRWDQLLGCLTIVGGLVFGLSRQLKTASSEPHAEVQPER